MLWGRKKHQQPQPADDPEPVPSKPAATFDPKELASERADWRRTARRNVAASVYIGLGLYVVLIPVLAAIAGWADQEVPIALQAGLSDADAVVLATSMLLLVASLNIAVVASAGSFRAVKVGQAVEIAMWRGYTSYISLFASSSCLAVALTRIASSIALTVTLLLVSALAIATAASTRQRSQDEVPRALRIQDDREKITRLETGVAGAIARFGPPDTSGLLRLGYEGGFVVFMMLPALTSLLLIYTVNVVEDIFGTITGYAALADLLGYVALAIIPSGSFGVATARYWRLWFASGGPGVAKMTMWRLLQLAACTTGGVFVAAGWLLFWYFALRDSRSIGLEDTLDIVILVLLPLVTPVLLLALAYYKGRGPGATVGRFAIRRLEDELGYSQRTLKRDLRPGDPYSVAEPG
jgi:hypothetical protein